MNMRRIQRTIKKELKAGASYAIVGNALGISKPEVGRILKGHYPGPKVAVKLGLPPVCHACKRRIPQPRQKQQARKPAHLEWWAGMRREERDEIIKRLYVEKGAY